MKTRISLAWFVLSAMAAFAQTGQCNNSPYGSCTADAECTGAGNYCHNLKHLIFLIKENRSFDSYFGTYPGVTGGPVGTASHPYTCYGASGGCSGGKSKAYAADPTAGQVTCGHTHLDAVTDYDSGAMDQFNVQCNVTGQSSWAAAYGSACSDWPTSHELCMTNSDCTSGLCNKNTLSTYWNYANSGGLADHMFSSMMGPSYPEHMYIFTATSAEIANNPEMSAGTSPNGQMSQTWNCDAFHYGRCSNAATTLCSTNADCSSGGTCTIDASSGKGYYNTSTSCVKNSDLGAALTNIVGNGTTATATCATNCGSMPTGYYVQIAGNSVAGFNSNENGYVVTSVTGSPVTRFTFASTVNATGKGGTATYDYCINGNVYTSASVGSRMWNIDQLGKSATLYIPGTCWENNTQACACSISGTTAPADPCTDITSTCSGTINNCVPTQKIGSTRGAACPNITTIGDRLDAASISWKQYASSDGGSAEQWNPVAYISHLRYGSDWKNNVSTTVGQFATDAGNCTSDTSCKSLASVVWITTLAYSEHPGQTTVAQGETFTSGIVNAVQSNTYLQQHSAIFIVWDDWGGFYDHIAPSQDSINFETGIRVPALCVGAYCKNQITKTTFRFESMLKCIENQYGLKPLNQNDANANDICTGSQGMIDLSLHNGPVGEVPTDR